MTTESIQKHYLVVNHISEETISVDGVNSKVYIVSLKPTEPEVQALTYATLSQVELFQFPLGALVEVQFKVTTNQ